MNNQTPKPAPVVETIARAISKKAGWGEDQWQTYEGYAKAALAVIEPVLKQAEEALDRGRFHARARRHLGDAIFISAALTSLRALLGDEQ